MRQMEYTSTGQAIIKLPSLRRRALSGHIAWRITSVLVAIVATVCLFLGPNKQAAANDNQAQDTLPTIDIRINDVPLKVELAITGQQRYMGLSFRESMDTDAGMLFVYPAERALTFTMRNTRIPLSIAFISEDLVINEIHLMDVGPGQLFDSEKVAMFALEVNQGWFKKNGIKAGDRIVMP